MSRLSATTGLTLSTPAYDVAGTGVGIVHLGPGAFHRAHQAVFTEDALQFGGDWRICGIQMNSTGVRDALRPQDYRYVLAVLGESTEFRIIHSISEILVAAEDREAVMERMIAPETHIITLTITEKGYCLTPSGDLDTNREEIVHDLRNRSAPRSAIGLLAEVLRRRRAGGVGELTIISCDNLADNGHLLGAAVVRFAGMIDKDLADWIDENVRFPRTMVDSITPATDDALRERVRQDTGLEDALPVSREPFSQWVIEDSFSGPRPAWDKVGVTLTKDVSLYENAKLRMLNGAHSALAYTGMCGGYETVAEVIDVPEYRDFIRQLMIEEVVPTLTPPAELNLTDYCDSILQRFANPAIVYRLSQIAWDSSQKIRFRIFPTIVNNLRDQRPCARLIMAVAAWMQFVVRAAATNSDMTDPLRADLLAIGRDCFGNASEDVARFLQHGGIFPSPLDTDTEFRKQLESAYAGLNAGVDFRQFQ